MKIHVLTPVHIGTGEILTPYDFTGVDDGGSDDAVVWARINLSALIDRVYQGDAERICEEAAQFSTLRGTHDFASNYRAHVEETALYRVALDHAVTNSFSELRRSEIRECAKAGYRGYLPGSSLKGALLTAYFFGQYDTWPEAQGELHDDGGYPRNPEREAPAGLSPRLRVADTLGEAALSMYLCRRIKRKRSGDLHAITQYVECLDNGQVLHAEVTPRLDRQAELPCPLARGEIIDLCAAANTFSKAVARKDLAHMRDHDVPEELLVQAISGTLSDVKGGNAPTSCLLRIGWGVGEAATSVQLLSQRWAEGEYPKTRWLVANPVGDGGPSEWAGGRAIPLGWVRIDFEESDWA